MLLGELSRGRRARGNKGCSGSACFHTKEPLEMYLNSRSVGGVKNVRIGSAVQSCTEVSPAAVNTETSGFQDVRMQMLTSDRSQLLMLGKANVQMCVTSCVISKGLVLPCDLKPKYFQLAMTLKIKFMHWREEVATDVMITIFLLLFIEDTGRGEASGD